MLTRRTLLSALGLIPSTLPLSARAEEHANSQGVAPGNLVRAQGSTQSRSLEERFAETVNVKDYGARGDDEADDTDALLLAITRASDIGGEVFLPHGIFRFSDRIPVPNLVGLYGVGRGSQLKAMSRSAQIHYETGQREEGEGDPYGNRSGETRRLLINGNFVSHTAVKCDVTVFRSFRDIIIENAFEIGFHLHGSQNGLYDAVNIRGGRIGLLVTGEAAGNLFTRNEYESATVCHVLIGDDTEESGRGPIDNQWIKCIAETIGVPDDYPQGYPRWNIRSGFNNIISDCNFSGTGSPLLNNSAVCTTIRGGLFVGHGMAATAIKTTGYNTIIDGVTLEAFPPGSPVIKAGNLTRISNLRMEQSLRIESLAGDPAFNNQPSDVSNYIGNQPMSDIAKQTGRFYHDADGDVWFETKSGTKQVVFTQD